MPATQSRAAERARRRTSSHSVSGVQSQFCPTDGRDEDLGCELAMP